MQVVQLYETYTPREYTYAYGIRVYCLRIYIIHYNILLITNDIIYYNCMFIIHIYKIFCNILNTTIYFLNNYAQAIFQLSRLL